MSFDKAKQLDGCQCLIKNLQKMQKTILYSILGFFGIFLISSCEKEEECHPCHIAFHVEHEGEDDDEEIEGEIGEFCGDELEDVEKNGYDLQDDLIVGSHTIPAGSYPASEVHCEEHADH